MAPLVISTVTEIAASPDVIRAKFLDFPKVHLYHHPPGLIQSITPLNSTKTGMDVKIGDSMKVVTSSSSMNYMVFVNNPTTFIWQGTWPFLHFSLLTGTHTFQFLPTPDSTTENPKTWFVQEEVFVGVLAWMFWLEWLGMGAMVRREFEVFGRNLGRWVEGGEV